MRRPLSLGTMSPPADVSRIEPPSFDESAEEHDERSDGATRADAPPIAIVFRKSLRLAIVYSVYSFIPTYKYSKNVGKT